MPARSPCTAALFDDAPDDAFNLNIYFDRAIAKGRLFGIDLDGHWLTVGTPEAIGEAEETIRPLPDGSVTTMTDATANVLTIPPGLPFLKTLVAALCDGRLTGHFRYDPGRSAVACRVTIFVPTRRAARVLRSEFVDLLGGRSAILPMIRPLGETDDDSGFFDAEMPGDPRSGAAACPIPRG